MNTTEQLSFSLPLSFKAHAIAQELCQGISNPEKAEQVYLNSLAVFAVDNYLRCMGFDTNWEKSDSRDKLAIQLMDVADLEIKTIGKLECRPVLLGVEQLEIPPEVWESRIGYVAVQLDDSLREANILGFVYEAAPSIALHQLQSLEDFLLHLSKLEQVISPQHEPSKIIKIGQWLEGCVDAGWEKIDELLKPQQLGLAFKNEVSMTRGQKVDLGMQIDKLSLALVVKVTSDKTEELGILTQVHPFGKTSLPEGVKLIVSDEFGETVLEAVSREEDNWIQSEFSADLGEKFQIKVVYGDSEVSKEFEV
ncbi:hypothetical protein NIES4071_50500 [Calothrix sp. NIES-4071]|nr:hypothetical protein NIES4071_50500 [Calothrix sp. NIES-4071]BAZ59357.1 hypothetical protein NIES4105_50440 [Calothrix sp. NIES-4105]